MLREVSGQFTEPNEDCRVYCVRPGTKIGRDASGHDLVVTDEIAVNIGNEWWVTQAAFDQIQAMDAKRSRAPH